VLSKVERAESAAVDAMGAELRKLVQFALRISARRGKGPRGGTVWLNPSKPGEAPHHREGNLKSNIFHEHDSHRRVSKIGWRSNAIYGYYHERGIRYRRVGMQKRPHIMPTFEKNKQRLAALGVRRFKAIMG